MENVNNCMEMYRSEWSIMPGKVGNKMERTPSNDLRYARKPEVQ